MIAFLLSALPAALSWGRANWRPVGIAAVGLSLLSAGAWVATVQHEAASARRQLSAERAEAEARVEAAARAEVALAGSVRDAQRATERVAITAGAVANAPDQPLDPAALDALRMLDAAYH